MRALVLTSVHNPQDARIRARQVQAMLDAGWHVTYLAPFTGYGISPPDVPGLTPVDIARSAGRHRLAALRGARTALRSHAPGHDIVLVHDPELLLAIRGLDLPPVVWDVHEDTAASLSLKPWLPRHGRALVASAVRRAERWAEDNIDLIVAEPTYRSRFRRPHLVVPNTVHVPIDLAPEPKPYVVYIGALTQARGAVELVQLARSIHAATAGALTLKLVGPADDATTELLESASAEGILTWVGFLPSHEAMAMLPGAVAGLSLLHDTPNYRISMPTKVLEYMAHGVPVITTPLPLVKSLVTSAECGVVVPFGDAEAAARVALRLHRDAKQRRKMGGNGHTVALQEYNWSSHAPVFLAELERISRTPRA